MTLKVYVFANVRTGTGKTTVIVQVLFDIIKSHQEIPKILMTASTHNGAHCPFLLST